MRNAIGLCTAVVCCLGLMLPEGLLGATLDTVAVAIPDTTAPRGETVVLPVRAEDDVTGLGVYSIWITLTYDPIVLHTDANGVSLVGTIAESWAPPTVNVTEGRIRIAAAGSDSLVGSGPLVRISFDVIGLRGESTLVHFEKMVFNQGDPVAKARDGLFQIPGFPAGVLSLPGLSVPPGLPVRVPIYANDLTDFEIFSVGFRLTYDPSVLEIHSVSTEDGLLASWGSPTVDVSPGEVVLGIAGTTPAVGEGKLFTLEGGLLSAAEGDSTQIAFAHAMLNEGRPSTQTVDGYIRIATGLGISGKVVYYPTSQAPVPDVHLKLTDIEDGPASPLTSTSTNAQGRYGWGGLSPGKYVSRPSKEGDIGSAISSMDASVVLQHLVTLLSLSPAQRIAADVSGNGSISAFDASLILRKVVGLLEGFPVGREWTFVPAAFPLTEENWRSAPDSLSYLPLNAYLSEENYRAIVHGDVTGNWSAGASAMTIAGVQKGMSKRAYDPRTVHLGAPLFSGDRVTFPLFIDDMSDILAGDIGLRYDDEILRLTEIRSGAMTSEYLLEHRAADGQLHISFASASAPASGGRLFELLFERASRHASLSDALLLDGVVLNEGAVPVSILQTDGPTAYALSQNYPNPFNPETTLRYELPESGVVRIAVYGVSGQLVRILADGYRPVGTHVVRWDGVDDRGMAVASGMYLCRMETEGFTAVRKLLLMK